MLWSSDVKLDFMWQETQKFILYDSELTSPVPSYLFFLVSSSFSDEEEEEAELWALTVAFLLNYIKKKKKGYY